MEYLSRKNKKAEIQRQQDHWNEVHEQLLTVQKKSLSISNPGDSDEQEADDVARKVVNGESAEINGSSSLINRKGSGEAETTPEFQNQLKSQSGSGTSLNDSTRSEMESKMGADFSNVKIHTGSEANSLSESINAKAFTHGQDVYFKQGQFNPNSNQGKELLAHELVHTVQQGSGKVRPKIQRFADDGKDVKTNLRKEEYRRALAETNIDFLIKKDIGQNFLQELGIRYGAYRRGRMTVLQAGALAYDFGMLALRDEYIYGAAKDWDKKTTRLPEYEQEYDPTAVKNKLLKADSDMDLGADINEAEFRSFVTARKKEYNDGKLSSEEYSAEIYKIVDFVFQNPDLSLDMKKGWIKILADQSGLPLSDVDVFDKKRQEIFRTKIDGYAVRFFNKMRDSGWIDLRKVDPDKRSAVTLPDQFLGAVGDTGASTGMAKSPIAFKGPRGYEKLDDDSVGVGYFMYDQSSKKTTAADGLLVRASPLYPTNTVYLTFPNPDLMQVRFAGYGFDEVDGEPFNANPTEVKVYREGVAEPIFFARFKRLNDEVLSTTEGVSIMRGDKRGSVSISLDKDVFKDANLRVEIRSGIL